MQYLQLSRRPFVLPVMISIISITMGNKYNYRSFIILQESSENRSLGFELALLHRLDVMFIRPDPDTIPENQLIPKFEVVMIMGCKIGNGTGRMHIVCSVEIVYKTHLPRLRSDNIGSR